MIKWVWNINILESQELIVATQWAIPFENHTPMEEGNSVTIPVEQTVKSSRKI